MAESTKIEWCDHTFSPWIGCQKVSPACKNCYAEVSSPTRVSRKIGLELWGPSAFRRATAEQGWKDVLKWDRSASLKGKNARVFCASLSDVFEEFNGTVIDHKGNHLDYGLYNIRDKLFDTIISTRYLNWLLLTKRPQNIPKMLPASWLFAPPRNLWLGTTVENQKYAEERIPKLIGATSGDVINFLSVEPMLGPIHLGKVPGHERIKWVICGGESGGKTSRPMSVHWVRMLRDECADLGIPFLFKQWGDFIPIGTVYHGIQWNKDHRHEIDFIKYDGKTYTEYEFDDRDSGMLYLRVGKEKAGRQLDGRTHDDYPRRDAR